MTSCEPIEQHSSGEGHKNATAVVDLLAAKRLQAALRVFLHRSQLWLRDDNLSSDTTLVGSIEKLGVEFESALHLLDVIDDVQRHWIFLHHAWVGVDAGSLVAGDASLREGLLSLEETGRQLFGMMEQRSFLRDVIRPDPEVSSHQQLSNRLGHFQVKLRWACATLVPVLRVRVPSFSVFGTLPDEAIPLALDQPHTAQNYAVMNSCLGQLSGVRRLIFGSVDELELADISQIHAGIKGLLGENGDELYFEKMVRVRKEAPLGEWQKKVI